MVALRVVQTGVTRQFRLSMDAAERHVLDVVPVGAPGVGGAPARPVALRYANDEAKRAGAPDDDEWRDSLHGACLAQEPVKLERPRATRGRRDWWRA